MQNKFMWIVLGILLLLAIVVFQEYHIIRQLPLDAVKCVQNPTKYAEDRINTYSKIQVSCYCTEESEKPLWNLIHT